MDRPDRKRSTPTEMTLSISTHTLRQACRDMLQAVAARCDGARTLDGAGFAGCAAGARPRTAAGNSSGVLTPHTRAICGTTSTGAKWA